MREDRCKAFRQQVRQSRGHDRGFCAHKIPAAVVGGGVSDIERRCRFTVCLPHTKRLR